MRNACAVSTSITSRERARASLDLFVELYLFVVPPHLLLLLPQSSIQSSVDGLLASSASTTTMAGGTDWVNGERKGRGL